MRFFRRLGKVALAPILGLFNACSPLGEPVDAAVSDSHYYRTSGEGIVYSRMGNWFELGHHPIKADAKSFRPLSAVFGRDSQRLYYRALPVDGAEPELEQVYVKREAFMDYLLFDSAAVYSVTEEGYGPDTRARLTKIEGADPGTFRSFTVDWSEDRDAVYFRYQPLHADPRSFRVISDFFVADDRRTFYRRLANFVPFEGDPQSLGALGDGSQAMDDEFVYWIGKWTGTEEPEFRRIPYNDPDEIELLNHYFLRIGDRIFADGAPVAGADAATFSVVHGTYGKDTSRVYFENRAISGADAASFARSDSARLEDKLGWYRDGRLVKQ